jgi:hypothetical protein
MAAGGGASRTHFRHQVALPEGRDLNLQAWRSLRHAFRTAGSLSKFQNSTIRSRGCKASGYVTSKWHPNSAASFVNTGIVTMLSCKIPSPTRLILNSTLHFVPDLHVKTEQLFCSHPFVSSDGT